MQLPLRTPFRRLQVPAVIFSVSDSRRSPELGEGNATIKVVALSVAAWPLAAHAQQPDRMRRLGVLISTAEADVEGQARVAALRLGLLEHGWVEGPQLGNSLPLG